MTKGAVLYHRAYLRLHGQYENYAAPIIKQALDEQIKTATSLIGEDDMDNISFYLQYLPSLPIKNALAEIYPPIGTSAAGFAYKSIQRQVEQKAFAVSVGMETKDGILDFFNADWIRDMVNYFLLNAGEKIKGITDTTIKEIRRIIAEAQSQNLTRREQAKYITETLNDPAFNRARSLVIARTESTTAANAGINIGAESSDYYIEKFWIATLDKRTRLDHKLANLQPAIPFNTPFFVGGYPMQYPGDATAPAKEVVNCRCVMGTQAILDADGLPILKPRVPRMQKG